MLVVTILLGNGGPESLMAPLRSHSQIQSRSGSFTSQSVLVALPGIKWDCVQVQALDWAAVQGAAVMLDREAEAGSLGAGDLGLPSLQP